MVPGTVRTNRRVIHLGLSKNTFFDTLRNVRTVTMNDHESVQKSRPCKCLERASKHPCRTYSIIRFQDFALVLS